MKTKDIIAELRTKKGLSQSELDERVCHSTGGFPLGKRRKPETDYV